MNLKSKITATNIAKALGLVCKEDITISGVCIDSRSAQAGDLFIAIRGERFDGHDYISEAINKGAVAVVSEQDDPKLGALHFKVKDTLNALAKIAAGHRQLCACDVIALTGSNGKTSVKEMIASILPQPAFATRGNFNNHIGVPLSVFELNPSHQYAVFELGASARGEIAHTVEIVKPKVTLINNIAPAHIEGFGSIEGVAKAKGEIHQGLATNGFAVVNEDDAYAHYWDDLLEGKSILRFSVEKPVDIFAENLRFHTHQFSSFDLVTPAGKTSIQLKVPGIHNVRNALAAAACTYALGLSLESIQKGLECFQGVAGRMAFRKGKNNALILDDTYNANLRSVLAALEVLATYPGRRIFAMGDLGELGQWTIEHHQEIGAAAKKLGIDEVLTIGQHSLETALAFGQPGQHFDYYRDLASAVASQLDENTTVLVKGSRSAAMEKVVELLLLDEKIVESSHFE